MDTKVYQTFRYLQSIHCKFLNTLKVAKEWLSGKQASSTLGCSWIGGLASTNTYRSQLPRPSNVEQAWLFSCPRLVDPWKHKDDWWRAWCSRSCFAQLRSRLVHYKTMLSYPEKNVLNAEKCCAENSLSIKNCIDECCVRPGERSVNRFIGEGKAKDLSAP